MRAFIDDNALGRLTWDADQRVWRGEVELRPDLRVAITVEAEDAEVDAVLPRVARGTTWVRANEEHARRCVADAYLDTFNESWSEEGPITRDEFARRITLVEVSFGTTGGLLLWYDDGDLFAGHLLAAVVDENGRMTGVTLSG